MRRRRRFPAFRLVEPTEPLRRAASLQRSQLRVAPLPLGAPARRDRLAVVGLVSARLGRCPAPLGPVPRRWPASRDPRRSPAAALAVPESDPRRRWLLWKQEKRRRIVPPPAPPQPLHRPRAARFPRAREWPTAAR